MCTYLLTSLGRLSGWVEGGRDSQNPAHPPKAQPITNNRVCWERESQHPGYLLTTCKRTITCVLSVYTLVCMYVVFTRLVHICIRVCDYIHWHALSMYALYMYVYTFVLCINMSLCMYVYLHICAYVCICIYNTCVCVYISVQVCTCMSLYVCM